MIVSTEDRLTPAFRNDDSCKRQGLSRKLTRLLWLALRNRREAGDRVRAFVEVRLNTFRAPPEQQALTDLSSVVKTLHALLGLSVEETEASEKQSQYLSARLNKAMSALPSNAPFRTSHNADASLAYLCYLLCKLIRPRVVVETGVAYGVTTAYILRALSENRQGILHSIDLPPLAENGDDFVGYLVPLELRERWCLHRGVARRILPALLDELGQVDLFCHDSLHTYWNMRFEFRCVLPYMAPVSAVVSDDVGCNEAFQELVAVSRPIFAAVIPQSEKPALCGMCIYRRALVPSRSNIREPAPGAAAVMP